MAIANGHQVGSHSIASIREKVVCEDFFPFLDIFRESSKVSMQVVLAVKLDLLNGFRLRNKLHETNFFCACYAFVVSEPEVEVDFFQQGIHQLEKHEHKLILSQVITILIDNPSIFDLRHFLSLSFFRPLTEHACPYLEKHRLDRRSKDGARISFYTIAFNLRIEWTCKTLWPQIQHTEIGLWIFELGAELGLLWVNFDTFESFFKPDRYFMHPVFELSAFVNCFIDHVVVLLEGVHQLFPHVVVELFHLRFVRVIIAFKFQVPVQAVSQLFTCDGLIKQIFFEG